MINLLTPYMLNSIDFSEAQVINYPQYINGELEILCGGIILLGEDFYKQDKASKVNVITNLKKDMYLSGICKFKFTEIISYSIELFDQSGFINGKTERLSKNDERESFATAVFSPMILCNPCNEYLPKYPPEYIDIVIETRNPIEMSYNNSDLVDVSELYKSRENFEKYMFRNK